MPQKAQVTTPLKALSVKATTLGTNRDTSIVDTNPQLIIVGQLQKIVN